MRDRRDFVIAALAAALIFTAGLLLGGAGSVLPQAAAQDGGSGGSNGAADTTGGNVPPGTGTGITIGNDPLSALRNRTTTTSPTASDSNSNNRFVAVTTPIGSGESALFLIDSKTEQLAVYRFLRNKGLSFMAARKIDFDLRLNGYEDHSEYSREQLRLEYEKQIAKSDGQEGQERQGRLTAKRTKAGWQMAKSGEFYTFDEVVRQLKIDEGKLKRLVSEGEISAFREGDVMKFKRTEIDKLSTEEWRFGDFRDGAERDHARGRSSPRSRSRARRSHRRPRVRELGYRRQDQPGRPGRSRHRRDLEPGYVHRGRLRRRRHDHGARSIFPPT